MNRHRMIAAVSLTLSSAYCAVVYFFSPQQYGFYPACVFYQFTGLLCPGCGSTRALHFVLHGDLLAAAALNPLVVVVIPFMLAVAGWQGTSILRSGKFAPLPLGSQAFPVTAGILVVFTVLRNLI